MICCNAFGGVAALGAAPLLAEEPPPEDVPMIISHPLKRRLGCRFGCSYSFPQSAR